MNDNREYLTEEQIKQLLEQNNIPDETSTATPYIEQNHTELHFSFKDLTVLDDRSLQFILRRTIAENDIYVICTAIKQESEEFINQILRNVSKRMAGEIKKELYATKEVQAEEIAKAQQIIVELVKRYAKQGDILIISSYLDYHKHKNKKK